jgi:pimeloyl-ACP methyl ester carboxylesterase
MKIFKLKTSFGKILIRDSKSAGTACMMLHGNSQSSEQFELQFKALGDKYRLIAWDYPGHGDSDSLKDPTQYNIVTYASIGFSIIKHLGINYINLFGWSLGGHVALEMIRAWQAEFDHRLIINSLMITGTPPCEFTEQNIQQAFTLNPEIFALSNNEKWQLEDAKKWVEFSGLKASEQPNAVKTALKADGKSRTYMLKHLLENKNNQKKDFENFAGPVAIIVGEKDKHINPDYMRSIRHARFFKNGPIFMKHVGHSPFLEDPTAFNQYLDEFLSETPAIKSKL